MSVRTKTKIVVEGFLDTLERMFTCKVGKWHNTITVFIAGEGYDTLVRDE